MKVLNLYAGIDGNRYQWQADDVMEVYFKIIIDI